MFKKTVKIGNIINIIFEFGGSALMEKIEEFLDK